VERVYDSVTAMIWELEWESLEERRMKDRLCNLYRAAGGKGG
jgi:hypothetical protein